MNVETYRTNLLEDLQAATGTDASMNGWWKVGMPPLKRPKTTNY